MNNVNQIKGHLARILATENIHIRHEPGAETASFDVKNRVLHLPVWQNISNDLYDMLIVHEVGHALDTPADGWVNAIQDIVKRSYGKRNPAAEMAVKDFLNVIEDARIDKRQKRRFPGSKRNYVVGLKELYKNDFFNLRGRVIDQLSFIDRANLYFKGGATLLNIKFSDEERVFIRRMEKAETFEEVIALTEDVFAFSKAKGEEQQVTIRKLVVSNKEDDDDEDFDADIADDVDVEFDLDDVENNNDDDSSNDGLKVWSEKDDEDDEDNKSNRKSQSNNQFDGEEEENDGDGAGESEEEFVPKVETEEAARNNIRNYVANPNVEFVNCAIPTFNYSEIVEDYVTILPRFEKEVNRGIARYRYGRVTTSRNVEESKKNFQEWKMKERDTISFMVKEFEARKSATAYSRQTVSKTGVLDPNKLHSYKFNDDVFRRVSIIPKGKNHGFVMFVDWSASMDEQLQETVKQLLSLTLFCKKVGIPFEVYYFRSAVDADFGTRDIGGGRYSQQKRALQMSENEGELSFGAFRLCNILSSRMNHATFNRAMTAFWMAGDFQLNQETMHSTPLNQAILAADKIINDFRKRNKVEIVSTIFLTDGGSDSCAGIVEKQPDGTKARSFGNPVVSSKPRRWILTDPVTKRSFYFDKNPAWGRYTTNVFLEILKLRTGSNLIGFFLSSSRNIVKVAAEIDQYDLNTEANDAFYKKHHYIAVKTLGYDDYYVINARKLAEVYDDTLNVDSKMTKGKITREFIRFSGRKAVNRVLLTSFVEHVATDDDSKKAA